MELMSMHVSSEHAPIIYDHTRFIHDSYMIIHDSYMIIHDSYMIILRSEDHIMVRNTMVRVSHARGTRAGTMHMHDMASSTEY